MHIGDIATGFVTLDERRPDRFSEMARAAFEFQRREGEVYGRFCGDLAWTDWRGAPPLPVRAFKELTVTAFPASTAERTFRSSSTGRGGRSTHFVKSLAIYDRSAECHFERVFGTGPFTFVGHLPHYSDAAEESSLVYMVDRLIRRYGDTSSGFFLKDRSFLERAVRSSRETDHRLLLFGAALGLVELLEDASLGLPRNSIVIETGGMKMRRREIGRDELHEILAAGFGIRRDRIFSEYGMCEMLSQCYTRGDSVFIPPPWLRFRILDPQDMTREVVPGRPGLLAFFDLANLYTVSAIVTEDLAVQRGSGFEVLGRLTDADLRGCNLLFELNAPRPVEA